MNREYLKLALWVLTVVLLTIFGAVQLACPRKSSGATLRLTFTAPTTNEDGSPLTDLKDVLIVGRRCGDRDSIVLGAVPCMPGDSVAVDLDIADGTVGWVWPLVRDTHGNMSKKGSETTFAFPLVGPGPTPDPGSGLLGEYWTGTKQAPFQALLAVKTDTTVNYNWGSGAPLSGMPSDSFCVRWTGTVTIPTSGSWTFYVASDDGFRFWLDGVLFDWWDYTFEQEITTGTKSLTAGVHSIKLEYFEGTGVASCHLRWAGPGVSKSVVPKSALAH